MEGSKISNFIYMQNLKITRWYVSANPQHFAILGVKVRAYLFLCV